jgi:hypothetical protein
MNHLLSDSPWNYQDVLADLCIKTSEVLSGTGQEVGLLIDEVGFRKKGRHSACVGRQYLGCIGKHDNGQVAVVAGLSSGKYYCPIDVALFMPKSWQDDHIRRKKAKIPENIQHQSKPDMAGAMIASMRKMAINFDYVAFDALYGNSFDLLSALHAENILFVGDVRDNVKISVEPITYSLPEKPPHSKGRKFKHKRVDQALTSLSQYCGQLGLEDFKQLHFRDGTKQKISAYFHQKEIWLVSKLNPWFSRVVFASDNKDTICSTEFVVWQPKIASMKCYLYQIAIHPHFIAYSTQNATGTSNSHKRVNPKVMMKYKVAFNEEFAISYSKRMRQFIQQMQNNQKQNQKLSELRDWLLPMLMNGQVRVSDKLSASGFSGFRDGQDLGMVAEEGGEYGS